MYVWKSKPVRGMVVFSKLHYLFLYLFDFFSGNFLLKIKIVISYLRFL